MPTEWAFWIQPLFNLSHLIGIITAVTDKFAATCHHTGGFTSINRERQTTNRAAGTKCRHVIQPLSSYTLICAAVDVLSDI